MSVACEDFQFPFHRDGPCDQARALTGTRTAQLFQFPFHRDGPCDVKIRSFNLKPYSDFQFPFHRDGPCDLAFKMKCYRIVSFQFPFHRDGPCDGDLPGGHEGLRPLSVPFSSGWALRLALVFIGYPIYNVSFSSLFIGMGLAMSQ